jgi:hypothetical protein
MPQFDGLDPWRVPTGPVPAYPRPSNAADVALAPPSRPFDDRADSEVVRASELREQIRRLIVEELREIVRG